MFEKFLLQTEEQVNIAFRLWRFFNSSQNNNSEERMQKHQSLWLNIR